MTPLADGRLVAKICKNACCGRERCRRLDSNASRKSEKKEREREREREREKERKKERKKEREGEEMLGKEMKCPKERKDLNKMSPCPTEKSKPSRDIVQELCEMIILSRYASVVL